MKSCELLPSWARLVAGQLQRDRAHPATVTLEALQEGEPHPRHAPSAPAAHGSDQAQTRLLRV